MTSRPYVESLVFLGGISADIRTSVDRHPDEYVPTVWGEDGALCPGGRAAGAAVAAVRLGRRFVDLIGCVGDDMLGRSILGSLKENGVSTRLVDVIKNVPTGVQQIVTDANGDRRVVGATNANAYCLEAQALKADSTIFGADLLIATLEVPITTVNRITRTATGRDVPVMLDATPFPTADGVENLHPALLSRTDVLLANWPVAQRLAGMSDAGGPVGVQIAERLLKMGPRAVVFTMGEHGAMAAVAGRHAFVDGLSGKAIDTSAAGEAFAGALAVGLTNQARDNWRWDQLLKAVRFAGAAAAACVQKPGGHASLPNRDEVEKLLIEHPSSPLATG